MLSQHELNNLLEVLSDDTKTFEQCLSHFNRFFNKSEWFKACCSLSFLIEGNLLQKSQRIIAFYILYELYRHENVSTTPFEAVVLSQL